MRRVCVAAAAVLLVCGTPAWAESVRTQVRQLQNSPDYRVRISAALSLAKTRDRRAVVALATALQRDSEGSIRRVAALSLGRIIDDTTPARVRDRAVASLRRASRSDRDPRVREAATRSLRQLARQQRARRAGPSVFLHIGEPRDQTRAAPRGTTGKVGDSVKRALHRRVPAYAQSWPGGRPPTRAQLEAAGASAFFVGATVSSVRVERNGSRADVRCAVTVRVNPWHGTDAPERWQAARTATATGNGRVNVHRNAVNGGIEDCLTAVAEELTSSQVVPFLERLVANP